MDHNPLMGVGEHLQDPYSVLPIACLLPDSDQLRVGLPQASL